LLTSGYCEKTAEAILMPFDVMGCVGPRNRVLDRREYQCHLANTVEQLCVEAMSVGSATGGGDVACFQISLGNLVLKIHKRIRKFHQ